jgi:hypothetical protein
MYTYFIKLIVIFYFLIRSYWLMSEYNYCIEYMSGSQNLVLDALSRGPVETAIEPEVASLHVFSIINITNWIAALQRDSVKVACCPSSTNKRLLCCNYIATCSFIFHTTHSPRLSMLRAYDILT